MLRLHAHSSLSNADSADALIVVGDKAGLKAHKALTSFLNEAEEAHRSLWEGASLHIRSEAPGKRLVLAPIATDHGDYSDVRIFDRALRDGWKLAQASGAKAPAIVLALSEDTEKDGRFERAKEVTARACFAAAWLPLEAPEDIRRAQIGDAHLVGFEDTIVARAAALGLGHNVARELCAADPEIMRPEAFAAYCIELFAEGPVTCEVEADENTIVKDYPLLAAVARASFDVKRHQPRVIRLRYGDPNADRAFFLAGKGVTYDTGGADIKAGGHMAGMSRDKGGAAGVVGLFATLAAIQPKGVFVEAEIGAVRNSVGANCFVSDEIITSHAGVRVRIGNTDAEGRLCLADLLSHLRERALRRSKDSTLLSVATLTGHAGIAMGSYGAAIANSVAHKQKLAETICRAGDVVGDPFELSRLRKEDHAFIAPKSCAEDIISCNNKPSSQTPRGHQFPAAFLEVASGLHHCGVTSDSPLAFVHLDVGGGAFEGGDWQHGFPTGTPVSVLIEAFFS